MNLVEELKKVHIFFFALRQNFEHRNSINLSANWNGHKSDKAIIKMKEFFFCEFASLALFSRLFYQTFEKFQRLRKRHFAEKHVIRLDMPQHDQMELIQWNRTWNQTLYLLSKVISHARSYWCVFLARKRTQTHKFLDIWYNLAENSNTRSPIGFDRSSCRTETII